MLDGPGKSAIAVPAFTDHIEWYRPPRAKLVVSASFDDLAFVKHQNLVRRHDCGEPVWHHHDRLLGDEGVDGGLHVEFVLGVQCSGRLI